MRGRPPKRKNERSKAPTYSNGDTKLELLTRTKRALTQSRERISELKDQNLQISTTRCKRLPVNSNAKFHQENN